MQKFNLKVNRPSNAWTQVASDKEKEDVRSTMRALFLEKDPLVAKLRVYDEELDYELPGYLYK